MDSLDQEIQEFEQKNRNRINEIMYQALIETRDSENDNFDAFVLNFSFLFGQEKEKNDALYNDALYDVFQERSSILEELYDKPQVLDLFKALCIHLHESSDSIGILNFMLKSKEAFNNMSTRPEDIYLTIYAATGQEL